MRTYPSRQRSVFNFWCISLNLSLLFCGEVLMSARSTDFTYLNNVVTSKSLGNKISLGKSTDHLILAFVVVCAAVYRGAQECFPINLNVHLVVATFIRTRPCPLFDGACGLVSCLCVLGLNSDILLAGRTS